MGAGRYEVLGTDGYGLSEARERLRDYFGVDARHIALAALHALASDGVIGRAAVGAALHDWDIAAQQPDPAAF
mgnify:CR=1 FL=1